MEEKKNTISFMLPETKKKKKEEPQKFKLDDSETMTYQQRLKKLRNEHGASQRQIAEFLGVSMSRYRTCETGRYSFTIEEIMKLAEAYNVTLRYILNIDDVGQKNPILERADLIILTQLYDQVSPEMQKLVILFLKIFKEGKTLEDVLEIVKNIAPEEIYEKMTIVDDGRKT